ncbi:MAG: tetratricopeptide repeat protein [Desulfobacteraceae bacterium]|nr:tetratricopeptide repeat protein [Desulfobacteraceae bacterium]
MARKTKNPKKQNAKKAQKQKKRQERIKKQVLSAKRVAHPDIEDKVDHALGFVERGDLKEGKKLLTKLKKKHRLHPHVLYGIGVLAAFTKEYDLAIQSFNKAIEIAPDLVEAHYNMGVAYQKQFIIPEMITAYRQVIKYGESGSYTVHHAQDMLSKLEQRMRDDEGISLDEYIKGSQFFEQGFKYMQSQDWEAAITEFKSAIKLTPNHPQSYGNMGICYMSTGKKQDALDAFDKAIELDPSYEPALINRKIAEGLTEGKSWDTKVKEIEYYKDYPLKEKSYIKEIVDSQGVLPEK